MCYQRRADLMLQKKKKRQENKQTNKKPTHTTRKPKRNMGRSRSRSICLGPGVELHLLTAWPAPVSCHATFSLGSLQKTKKQNYHVAKFNDTSHQGYSTAKTVEIRPEYNTKERKLFLPFCNITQCDLTE